jgi:hypothetical protein
MLSSWSLGKMLRRLTRTPCKLLTIVVPLVTTDGLSSCHSCNDSWTEQLSQMPQQLGEVTSEKLYCMVTTSSTAIITPGMVHALVSTTGFREQIF